MVGLVDIAPAAESVTIRGQKIEVFGVSAAGVAGLLARFPELRRVFAGRLVLRGRRTCRPCQLFRFAEAPPEQCCFGAVASFTEQVILDDRPLGSTRCCVHACGAIALHSRRNSHRQVFASEGARTGRKQ